MGQAEISSALGVGQFYGNNAVSHPIVIVLPLPGKDNLLIRNDLLIFANDRQFLAVRAGEFPLKLAAGLRVRDQAARPDMFRAEPFLELVGIRPGGENPFARRFDKALDFERWL